MRERELAPETRALLEHFRAAMQGSPAAALAALYAYESRVPAIAKTKAEGLEKHYATDAADAALLYGAYDGGCVSRAGVAGCADGGAGGASGGA